ncbi:carbohydrate ABC transporter membrane protein 1, CUT1 family (TC 3.A.1.1.-) [Anaerocolumna jejuensis DSM 15929]|uniref:Carbohydrate ABC transporter membrane protein 1, CUT1 family (TC 3.A.1.1.-) n=1 Tax=Anaerocolumna jejuensis DSM 15929 TaxID=1121322 RepID=A0A1M7CER6_9FIRM|nr:sugar ABC transporter permease [Anaerocolumna jejuensis]SHL65660.1 carbohydrate ABC transporter membrane protein 1, CUT1 family (TC 3.A.1.1.-) [Anaerocolumna jejuensis DSM 15929]
MKVNNKKRNEYFWGYLMIAPVTLGLIAFYFYPFFQVIFDSFFKIGAFDRRQGFVGLDNYKRMLTDAQMWQTLINTFKYVIIIVPVTVIFSLIIAVLLNTKIKGLSVFRVVYFLPAITMAAAVSMVWRWIFNGDYGVLNGILGFFGADPVQWLNNKHTALICVCSVAIWSNVGYYMIILLAGIQGISKEYYEAADMDGATTFKRFWKITLPLLTPTLFYVVIMIIISTFQTFDGIYLMIGTKSNAIKYTQSVVMYFYRTAFDYSNKGYASAIAVMLFLIIMIITMFQMKMQKKWVNYD